MYKAWKINKRTCLVSSTIKMSILLTCGKYHRFIHIPNGAHVLYLIKSLPNALHTTCYLYKFSSFFKEKYKNVNYSRIIKVRAELVTFLSAYIKISLKAFWKSLLQNTFTALNIIFSMNVHWVEATSFGSWILSVK